MLIPEEPRESYAAPPPISRRLSRRTALTVTFGALALVYALWNIPQLGFIVYPFRLFVTYVHEAGHSLMALLSGGRIVGFEVFSDGSGLARTVGGSRALILPAGYLGAAFFGAVLFYIVNRYHLARTVSICLGVMLVVFSALFARPALGDGPIALVVGLLAGLGLITMGVRLGVIPNLIMLNVLAMMTALNAVLDLFFLIQNSSVTMDTRSGAIQNDAAAFSREVAPLIPPVVWALLWVGLALLMIGASVYYSIVRPMLRGTGRMSDREESALLRKMEPDEIFKME